MPKNFLKQIRENIKDEKGRAMSLQKLADKIGNITPSALSQFENGLASLSPETLQKIMAVLNITYEQLMFTGTVNLFGKKDKKLLAKAMDLAFISYGDLDRNQVVEIATEIYELLIEYDQLTNLNVENIFLERLNEKVITGLAAKVVLQQHKLK